MEKSEITSNMDGHVLNITPSAPPSYDEAVGGNFMPTNTVSAGLYYPPAALLPAANPQPASFPYPVQESTVVAIQPPRPIVGMLPVGPKSLKTTCPSCQKSIATRINTKNRLIKYMCCLLLLGSIVCSLCSCLPFCLCPSTKVEHFCPACNAYLGTYVYH